LKEKNKIKKGFGQPGKFTKAFNGEQQ